MSQRLWVGLILVLAAANLGLFWEVSKKAAAPAVRAGVPSYLTILEDGDTIDLRGVYTYPKLGKYTFPLDSSRTDRPSLSLLAFFSPSTANSTNQRELEVLKALVPVFESRGQRITAATTTNDSLLIARSLDSAQLRIPMITVDSVLEGVSLEQGGIGPYAMPFKVLYDSTMTAVYMRGADNTPESRAEFERTMLRLSELYAERSGIPITHPPHIVESSGEGAKP